MSERSYYLTLSEVAQSVRLTTETVITIVDHGIIEPRGKQPDEWLFEPRMLGTLRRATRLRRDLELDWEAIALAVTLIEQVHTLRGDNARLRQQLAFLLDPNDNN
jgi:chaperone modulatory protein CbpM